ncbi:4Fe-4S binding protein [Desulfovermiculus halophilus]|uniref:4Fe-4S binding protein n=1 Tax=Desulfovermiculus halophilus TaxID=339722 RepID=UPI00048A013D|nr:4Fe-4S binding protein [Desulfovermiculus halophilus]
MQQRIVQGGFLGLFILGVWLCFSPWEKWTPLPAMIRLDPLLWIGQWLSTKMVPAGLLQAGTIVLVTLILGRFFCSHVCPLGTSMEAVSACRGKNKRGWRPPQSWRRGKYVLLVILAAAALAGQNLTHWGSPLSLAGRLYTIVVWPFVHAVVATAGLSPLPGMEGESPRTAHLGGMVLLLGVVLGSAWVVPRFWCRYLCPTGAFLALISRLALITRKVGDRCTECGLCARKCPAGIAGPGRVPAGECLVCRRCETTCPQQSVTWMAADWPAQGSGFWPGRRQVLGSMILGAGAAWVSWGGLWSYRGEREKGQLRAAQLIRPPGAVPETVFQGLCVRCGACMRVCPTNMLQPQGGEQGVQGMFAPLAVARRGPCRPECAACGRVCPTGAIRSLPLPEKMWAKMGTAAIDRQLCLAWEWDRGCLVCDEACPYGAIDMQQIAGNQEAVPVVLENRCTGCGACEHACPVQGRAAIRVVSTGSQRMAQGSYRTRGRQLGLAISRGQRDEAVQSSPTSPGTKGDDLPPGFGQ